MRKLLNKPWFVAALALSACAFVGISLLPKKAITASAQPEVALENVSDEGLVESSAGEAGMSMEVALKELSRVAPGRDPFVGRPRVAAVRSDSEQARVPDSVDTLRLSAIWSQQGETYVLINGRIHQAGDEISRIKIESATQDGVWVAHWKGRDFVTLGSDFTLVTPAEASGAVASL